jgi:endonuclease YncB( thermonuclease family)
VRPRRDNHARAEELIALEAQAREAERGMWARRGSQLEVLTEDQPT